MRQKQSKENSRKQVQNSNPAVKREAETLPIFSNTTDKSQSARLESRITFGMSYSVLEKEYDKKSLKRKGKTMDEIAYLTGIHENVVRKLLGETASL